MPVDSCRQRGRTNESDGFNRIRDMLFCRKCDMPEGKGSEVMDEDRGPAVECDVIERQLGASAVRGFSE